MSLVLSIFPGADLLGRGFEREGFCVVRGPDLVWGGDVREFHPPPGKFAGVIGGSPCQDFSRARRAPPTGEGVELLGEFARVVGEAAPDWFLVENVPGVPDIAVPGYTVQRFNLNAAECGGRQRRLRAFQFGARDSVPLVLARGETLPRSALAPTCLATDGKKTVAPELRGFLRTARPAAVVRSSRALRRGEVSRSRQRRPGFHGCRGRACDPRP